MPAGRLRFTKLSDVLKVCTIFPSLLISTLYSKAFLSALHSIRCLNLLEASPAPSPPVLCAKSWAPPVRRRTMRIISILCRKFFFRAAVRFFRSVYLCFQIFRQFFKYCFGLFFRVDKFYSEVFSSPHHSPYIVPGSPVFTFDGSPKSILKRAEASLLFCSSKPSFA